MSRLLQLINRLKAQAAETMLTPGQRLVLAELEKRWQFPDRLNLCGPQGSGKTFLGWVMARQRQAHFYASPRVLERDQPPYPIEIIVDNASTEEKKLRRLLAELQLRQIRRVLLITRSPIRLGLPVIELASPNATDIAKIYENCSNLQFYPSQSPNNAYTLPVSRAGDESDGQIANFWHIIYSLL